MNINNNINDTTINTENIMERIVIIYLINIFKKLFIYFIIKFLIYI